MDTPLHRAARLAAIAPVVAALIAMTSVFLAWGSLNPIPTVGDEAAYVLQAQLLAHGRIVDSAPPAPEFFEQAHVQVVPVLAPKYPLGFGLAVAPGMMLHLTALVPILLTGLSAALLWILARRACGTGIALLATATWIAAPGSRYRAGFFSETLTTPLVLLAWYLLARWRAEQRPWMLASLSGCVAALVITRPLTAIVFALPILIVVVPQLWRQRAWRQGLVAIVAALPLLALLARQNVASGGAWWELTYDRYTRTYLPFDHIGFGLDTRAPLRERPADLERLAVVLQGWHHDFTPAHLPAILRSRLETFLADLVGPAALAALILLLMGALVAPPELRFAAASGALLFGVHLIYAHAPQWSIYYSEALPVAAVLVATGTSWLVVRILRRVSHREIAQPRAAILLALAVVALLPLPDRILRQRLYLEVSREPMAAFQQALAAVPGPAIVFVRYAANQPLQRSLVENQVNAATAPVLVARDRGADNARLLQLVPGRTAWLYDQSTQAMQRLNDGGIP